MIVVLAAALSLIAAADASQVSASAPAGTASTSAAQPAGNNDARNDPQKIVCRSEAVTGSRFTKRVCQTRAAWEEETRQAEVFQRRSTEMTGLAGQSMNPMGN